jgi:hypothetical protein
MKYYSKPHGLFSYFSACGMTFALIIAGTLVPIVPGMLSATAHPMAAKFRDLSVMSFKFVIIVKMELWKLNFGIPFLVVPTLT